MVNHSLCKTVPNFHGSVIVSQLPCFGARHFCSVGHLGSQLTSDFIICPSQGGRLDLLKIALKVTNRYQLGAGLTLKQRYKRVSGNYSSRWV